MKPSLESDPVARTDLDFRPGTRLKRQQIWATFITLLALTAVSKESIANPKETILYRFEKNADGYFPTSLILGGNGALYGSTLGSVFGGNVHGVEGTIFVLEPPTAGHSVWDYVRLYQFTDCADGEFPYLSLVSGAIYGSTSAGGRGCRSGNSGYGTVFDLQPVTASETKWDFHHAYRFGDEAVKDGSFPIGNFVMDSSGSLYGVTSYGGDDFEGTLFRMMPPASGQGLWTEEILYNFTGADTSSNPSGLTIDSNGVIYVTTQSGNGAVYSFSPPSNRGGVWTKSLLFSYTGTTDALLPEGLTVGPNGVIFGMTFPGGDSSAFGCGTIFALTPPSSASTSWKQQVLHHFQPDTDGCNPNSNYVIGPDGSIYGTTDGDIFTKFGNGTVFKLSPPASGHTVWSMTQLHAFKGGSDGATPTNSIALDANGTIYGATFYGGTSVSNGIGSFGYGTIYKITQ